MIIVIGEVLIDVFPEYRRIGGAPFNFAFHLKKLGWPVRFLTRIGNDFYGKDILNWISGHGFDVGDVQIDPRRATGTVRVRLDAQGVPQFDIRGDVAYDYIDLSSVGTIIPWHSVRMIYFGSLAQRTHRGFGHIHRFIARRSSHTKVFCDINLRPPHINLEAVAASLKQSDIVKLNVEELTEIRTMLGDDASEPDSVKWMMRRFSLNTVILTRGSEGSLICTADQRVENPTVPGGKVVDTVGAGDAYAAVAAAGLLNRLPLTSVVDAASGFAAFVCTLPGAVPEDNAAYSMLPRELRGSDHVE